jgi:50S ribosomal protein L16 3-hydroxylase
MQRRCAQALSAIEWSDDTVRRFLGCWLSEPKPSVYFERPLPALSLPRFSRLAAKHGLRLSARTQLLYDAQHLFVNGVALPWPIDGAAALRRLADRRALPAKDSAALPSNVIALLHDWYRDGFLATADA